MLTKLPNSRYVPAIRGVTAVPEHTVCVPVIPPGPPPAQGRWVTKCDAQRVLLGTWSRDDYEWGRCRYDEIGTPKYIDMGVVCRSEWVPNG